MAAAAMMILLTSALAAHGNVASAFDGFEGLGFALRKLGGISISPSMAPGPSAGGVAGDVLQAIGGSVFDYIKKNPETVLPKDDGQQLDALQEVAAIQGLTAEIAALAPASPPGSAEAGKQTLDSLSQLAGLGDGGQKDPATLLSSFAEALHDNGNLLAPLGDVPAGKPLENVDDGLKANGVAAPEAAGGLYMAAAAVVVTLAAFFSQV